VTGGEGSPDLDRAQIDQVRRRIINVVGHELRTPITTIRGLADLLGTTDDPESALTIQDALRRTARRAESLLDDLLVAAGISTALPVGEPEPTDLGVEVAEAWLQLGCDGSPPLSGGDGVRVLARPGVVRRALVLLVDNALKYGGGDIRLDAERADDRVVLAIANPSPAFAEQELPLLFEPFYRGERAVTLNPGLGLGLSVARALARQHGGDVELSQPDGRIVARLVLPAA
jgi:signal transduction histidine kinase